MVGTLSAVIGSVVARAAALTGDGQLTAEPAQKYTFPVALSGSGTLDAAQCIASYARSAALSGSGVISAIAAQIYPIAPALSGAGALSATAIPSATIAPAFSGAGTLSATARGPVTYMAAATGTNTTRGPVVTFASWTPLENDVVFMFSAETNGNLPATTVPSGWVRAAEKSIGLSGVDQLDVVYHIVTAAEQSAGTLTYTVTDLYASGISTRWNAHGIVIRNCDPNNIVDNDSVYYDTAASTTHVIPGLTGAYLSTGSMILSCIHADNTGVYTTPSGWTERATLNSNVGMWTGTRNTLATAGTDIANQNITISTTSRRGNSITIAVGGTLDTTAWTPAEVVESAAAILSASRSPSVTFAGYVPQLNDLVVLFPATKATSTITIPSGWVNPLGGTTDLEEATTPQQMCAVYHWITAAEVSAVTTTYTATNLYEANKTGIVNGIVVRNVDPTDPIGNFGTASDTSAVTSQTLPAIQASIGIDLREKGLVVACNAHASTDKYSVTTSGWTPLQTTNSTAHGTFLVRRNALTVFNTTAGSANVTTDVASRYVVIGLAFNPKPNPAVPELVASAYEASAGNTRSPSATFANYTPQLDDLVLMLCARSGAGVAITTPSGWFNPLGGNTDQETGATANRQQCIVGHYVTSAEVSAVTTTYSPTNLYDVSDNVNNLAIVLRGVNTNPANVIDSIATGQNGSVVTTVPFPGLTGSNLSTGSLVLVAHSGFYFTTQAPTGYQLIASGGRFNPAFFANTTRTTAGVNVASVNATHATAQYYMEMTIAIAAP